MTPALRIRQISLLEQAINLLGKVRLNSDSEMVKVAQKMLEQEKNAIFRHQMNSHDIKKTRW